MAIQKIKPGSRISEEDPLCHVKSEKELLSHDYDPKEGRNTEAGRWFEDRRVNLLLSNCMQKDPMRAQQDDGVTSDMWPVRDDSPPKPRTGGPVWTDKKHR